MLTQSLTDTFVFIAGGAGQVGEGLTRQFLAAGAQVVVSSRSEARLQALRERLEADEALLTIVGDVGSLDGAQAILQKIEAADVGPLTAVVASLGGWWQGEVLIEISLEKWHQLINNSLTAHFIAAKVFLPTIAQRAGSSYTFINGGGGLHPVPTAGPISVSAAGQLMLQKVLSAEAEIAQNPVRVNSLVLATPVKTRSRPQGEPGWLSADDAGRYAVYLASAAAAEVSGEVVVFQDPQQVPA